MMVNYVPLTLQRRDRKDEKSPSSSADGKKEVFVKTEKMSRRQEAEKLKHKMTIQKEKRRIQDKLSKVKGLGESDSGEESMARWVMKSRKNQAEKEMADKRAKQLEEMDAELEVRAQNDEELSLKNKSKKAYSTRDLKGIEVGHSSDVFQEGRNVILTLRDKGVLEEKDDVLENVNMIDDEKAAKNAENRLKKPDYVAYDEPEYDEFGIIKKKNLLYKYDEEILGPKKEKFIIGTPNADRQKELELIRAKVKQQQGVQITLEGPQLKLASEYYTEEEMVQFKKPKKRVRTLRKKGPLKPEQLLPLGENVYSDHGSRKVSARSTKEKSHKRSIEEVYLDESSKHTEMDIDQDDYNNDTFDPEDDFTGIPFYEDKADFELQVALNKARKLKEKRTMTPRSEKVMQAVNEAPEEDEMSASTSDENMAGSIVMNSTAEFCRTLGEIPTYGMSGNRNEEAEELMNELVEERKDLDQETQNIGAWNKVDVEERQVEIKSRENEPILEEEPNISVGLAGALKLARNKGYLEQETKQASAPRPSQLQAQSYMIEEKFYEDDKFGKRDRFSYCGPIQDFKEKDIYKPDVILDYVDDNGRALSAKEAFRQLSHKFHGQKSGKNKIDKRMKKLDQENRLKQMSSTDTPLNTLKMLQAKQKELQMPYIVLSGGNNALKQTSLSKPK